MYRWNGCVALVTGASRGIGAAISNKLLDHGINVVGCARNVQDLEKLNHKKSTDSSRGSFHPVKCDVSQEKEVLSMFDEIKRKFDRIHICVNNAGIIAKAPLMSGNERDWRSVMEVNILGACTITREAYQLMLEKQIKEGVIIHMGSIGGHKIANIPKTSRDHGIAFYNATKFTIRALAECIRQEMKAYESPNVRVSTIIPGPVRTAMLEKLSSEADAAYFQSVKCLDPEDVAEAVIYVLTAQPYVNVDDVIVQSVDIRV